MASRNRRSEKFQGSFYDMAVSLQAAFDPHEGHRMSHVDVDEDPNLCAIICVDCQAPVTVASRELIDLMWQEIFIRSGQSH